MKQKIAIGLSVPSERVLYVLTPSGAVGMCPCCFAMMQFDTMQGLRGTIDRMATVSSLDEFLDPVHGRLTPQVAQRIVDWRPDA